MAIYYVLAEEAKNKAFTAGFVDFGAKIPTTSVINFVIIAAIINTATATGSGAASAVTSWRAFARQALRELKVYGYE